MDRDDSDKLLILIVFFIGLDLLISGTITWSIWPASVFVFIYLLGLSGNEEKASREIMILKERFAKGEFSEEEYIRRKDSIEKELGTGNKGIRYFGGIALVFLGIFLVFRNLFHLSLPIFPLILIVVGLIAIYRKIR